MMGRRKSRRCSSAVIVGPPAAANATLVAATTSGRSSSRVPFQSQTKCRGCRMISTVPTTTYDGRLARSEIHSASQRPQQSLLVHPEVVVLPPIQQHYRNPVPVLLLQFRITIHTDLDPGHARGGLHPGQRLAGVFAQVTLRPGEQRDPGHRRSRFDVTVHTVSHTAAPALRSLTA